MRAHIIQNFYVEFLGQVHKRFISVFSCWLTCNAPVCVRASKLEELEDET